MSIQVAARRSTVIRRALSVNLLVVLSITSVLLLTSLARSEAPADAKGAQASTGGSSSTVTLPTGTQLVVRMRDSVNSETSQPNQRFRGTLETNLTSDGEVVAPKGTTVFGRLLEAQSAGARSGGVLEFDLTDIQINGQTYSLATSSNQATGAGAATGTGTGARAGAAVGAITGGVGGAVRGAGAGAVAGKVTSGNARGEKVNIPEGTLVEFSLENPVTLPVAAR
jgi:hypothetical protein